MNDNLKNKLIKIAKEYISKDDPSHDFLHHERVLSLALSIAKTENADLDIIIPAALFHDAVNYPKNDPRSRGAAEESAVLVGRVLKKIKAFPRKKILLVQTAIAQCSFSKGIMPELLESKILQDADRLEATGAIAIMRTFSSTGQMKRSFYHAKDPFAKARELAPFEHGLDLFYVRLLKVEKMMHTRLAKSIAKRRTKFLHDFLAELKLELEGK